MVLGCKHNSDLESSGWFQNIAESIYQEPLTFWPLRSVSWAASFVKLQDGPDLQTEPAFLYEKKPSSL